MAGSISLAVLENLVHMQRDDFPVRYVVVGAVIPTSIKVLTEDRLKARYGEREPCLLGDCWFDNGDSAVLRVRSAVVRAEFNYLLNPTHRDFSKVITEVPLPFVFDERLFRTE
jgi:RES domain-containing protein